LHGVIVAAKSIIARQKGRFSLPGPQRPEHLEHKKNPPRVEREAGTSEPTNLTTMNETTFAQKRLNCTRKKTGAAKAPAIIADFQQEKKTAVLFLAA